MTVSIVIPTYNERNNIVALIQSITKILDKSLIKFEIIIVDDNSPDNTYSHIKSHYLHDSRIRPFVRNKNRCLAKAILFGIMKTKGSIIIGMDADFNHPPSLIPKLISSLHHADFAVASRFIKGGGMKEPIRYYLTYIFNLFLKYILGFPILDNLSGFYAIKKIQEINPKAKIIAVSGDSSYSTEEKLEKLSIPLINKPFNMEQIISIIDG